MTRNGKSGNGKKREETAARIIKALAECNGLLTLTAKTTGLGYRTVCRYVAEFPSVKEAAIEAHEKMLDFAESRLYQKIKDGDNACIIFYLKCQGRARGFIERQEIVADVRNRKDPAEYTDAELAYIVQGRGGKGIVKASVGPQSVN